MSLRPLVSVVIPSYNHGQWISQAIDSVLCQTYDNTEVIVVDDASSDNSRDVIESFQPNNSFFSIFKPYNRGQGHSLNMAVDIARGKYICILPSDDWFLPTKIEEQVRLFEQLSNDYGLVYCHGLRFYQDLGITKSVLLPKYRGRVYLRIIANGNFVYPASTMIRRSVLQQIRFDESYRAEGEAIFFKIAASYKFTYVDNSLVVMREHGYNTGSDIPLMYRENIRWWHDFYSTEKDIRVNRLRGRVLARHHRLFGLSMLEKGIDIKTARHALLLAFFFYPKYILDFRNLLALALALFPMPVRSIVYKIRSAYGRESK